MASPGNPITFPLTGGLTRPLNTVRRWASSATAPTFDFGTLFASGQNGLVLSGFPGGSTFYETDAKVTPVTTSTDPCGAVTDVSGLGKDCIQAVSGNRVTYYVAGNGIRSWRSGDNRVLYPETDMFVTAAMSVVSVYKYITASADGAPIITSYVTPGVGWDAGGYFVLAARQSAPDNDIQILCDTNPSEPPAQTLDGATQGGSAAIARWDRAGTGSNQSVFTTYSAAAAQIATSTGTQNAMPTNKITLGYRGLSAGGVVEQCFFLIRDQPLSAGEWASLSGYLAEALAGGW